MKLWYDKKARFLSFKPGDQVLVLLPIHGQPLQVQYCSLYTVEQKVNEVDYVIKTLGLQKEKRLHHVNMLNPYHNWEESKIEEFKINILEKKLSGRKGR